MTDVALEQDLVMEKIATHARTGRAHPSLIIGAGVTGVLTVLAAFVFFQLFFILFGPEMAREDFMAGVEAGSQAAGGEGGEELSIDPFLVLKLAALAFGAATIIFGGLTGLLLWLRDKARHPDRPRLKGALRWVMLGLSTTEGASWLWLSFTIFSVVVLGLVGFFEDPASQSGGPTFEDRVGMSVWTYLALFAPMGVAVAGAMVYAFRSIRAVVRKVAAGDPFEPANGRRLMRAGVTLLIYQGVEAGYTGVAKSLIPREIVEGMSLFYSVHFWPGVFGLVLFAIGVAFREGARLREEQELTI